MREIGDCITTASAAINARTPLEFTTQSRTRKYIYYNGKLDRSHEKVVIPSDFKKVGDVKSNALFILLVEKDTVFSRLIHDKFYERFPCIIVTGKGYPDVSTRRMVRKLRIDLKLSTFVLVDCNVHGITIWLNYNYGSFNMAYDSENLVTPDIMWLGLKPSDFKAHNIPEDWMTPMEKEEFTRINNLLKAKYVRKIPELYSELLHLKKLGKKLDLESLSKHHINYLSGQYLPMILRDKHWI